MNDKPHWYHERVLLFAENEAQLPFDQHFVKALVAPRGLICIESTDDLYANPVGTYASSVAAMAVYELYGKGHLNGLRYRRGGAQLQQRGLEDVAGFCGMGHFTIARRRTGVLSGGEAECGDAGSGEWWGAGVRAGWRPGEPGGCRLPAGRGFRACRLGVRDRAAQGEQR